MSDEKEDKPSWADKLTVYFNENLAQPPEEWDIKVTHYGRGRTNDSIFFIPNVLRVPDYFQQAYPYGIALSDIDIVGAYYERVDERMVIHQYFKLDGYMKRVEWNAKEEAQPLPVREDAIADLLQAPSFLAVCINMRVIKVEDSQGDILDIENLTVPFIPAGSAPAPAPAGSPEAAPTPQALQ